MTEMDRRRPRAPFLLHTSQNMASGASASPHLLSGCVEKRCAADIYALQHRLERSLKEVELLTSSSAGGAAASRYGCGRADTRCVRRLGQLLREAGRLTQRVEEAVGGKNSNAQETVVPLYDDVDAPLHMYYRQQLQARFTRLQQDAEAARRLLTQYLSQSPTLAHLPLSCVGTSPQVLEGGLTGATAASFGGTTHIYADNVPPHVAYIPPAAVYSMACASPAVPDAHRAAAARGMDTQTKEEAGSKERRATAATASTGHPMGTSAAAGSATTAEDRIMADIQHAMQQMKNGALQMRALMEQEKSQMRSAADLLSDGVAKGQTNMHELDRVSYVAEVAHVPWWLRCVPGMPLLWRTVLQPMWAFIKQALAMAFILAVTGCVLLLISLLPKPTVYRVHPSLTHDSRASPLQSTAASAPVPAAAPTSPPSVANSSPPSSYEADTHATMRPASAAEAVREVTLLSPQAQSGPSETLDDL
ncbi:hypothetical protein LSCM1_01359 [Leishmania martiniquensis]|uniref:Uncharacterized protein n=1 Tax=Leishmania martiniquensis TaxID=1580590 RepID=A0A836GSY7_9TRYP|nr:hypothetical protein LSCM1_01359 [Leishmania martiniquensis]